VNDEISLRQETAKQRAKEEREETANDQTGRCQ
jgi:hypothetical protein